MNEKIRDLIFIKGFFVLLGLLFCSRILWFGEHPLLGETVQEPAPKEEPKTSEPASVGQKIEEEEKKSSILDGLLELPPLVVDDKKALGRYLALAENLKKQIDDKMNILEEKKQSLEKLNQTLDEKLKKIEEEKQFLLSTIQKEKDIQKERLDALLPLYEKMQPQKAAQVLETMDKDLVVALFKNLKKKQITQILENMKPQSSLAITEYFARVGSLKEFDLIQEMNRSWQETFSK